MKKTSAILAITLFALAGCGGNRQSADDLITVDVTKSYPEKELILQDFMDVEYVALETADEFLTQGYVRDIGKEIILVSNRNNDGDLFLFDRKTGKGLRKINRKGQGGEEYASIAGIILDEENSEIIVNSSANKILVYDLYGNFKRSFNHTEGASYADLFNYDRDHLFCYDYSEYYNMGEERSKSYHVILSKQDGSITRKIQVPFKTIIAMVVRREDGMAVASVDHIIPYHDNWALVETSSDTVYAYVPDGNISPLIVRTPSIRDMDPGIFLSVGILTDRYYFMKTVRNEFDFEKMTGFPVAGLLMYDRQEKAL
ncbi:MAG: 6-bladed beta-propeller, partial [Tannerellaceae bacterium]|nr:6-bladed beta-propeller [Tannerellaceae bacterium]